MREKCLSHRYELNRREYIIYYTKVPEDSYDIHKKTDLILTTIKNLNIKIENKNILDIGFGTGSTLMNLNKKRLYSYGIEFIKEPCLNLRFKMKALNIDIALIVASILKIPFKNAFFDIIICSHVLEHIEEDQAALQEVWRVLNTEGILIFLTPNKNYGDRHHLHYRTYSHRSLRTVTKNNFAIKFQVKYRSFIDNILYKIPSKYKLPIKIIKQLSWLDRFLASKLKNLEDLYILMKVSH